MTDLNIGKALEEKENKNHSLEIEKAVKENVEDNSYSQDGKSILIMVLVIIGIFAVFMGGFQIYSHFTTAAVLDIDQMHQENLNGDLNPDEGYIYNGFSFVKVDGLWWTEINRNDVLLKIPLHYGPEEVKDIPIFGELDPNFSMQPINIAIDPTINYNKYYTLALMEMNNNIVQGTKTPIVSACNQESPICEDRPIVDCNNPEGKAIIELIVSEKSEIELKGTCIQIKGQEYDLVKATDRLLLQWYGIMN